MECTERNVCAWSANESRSCSEGERHEDKGVVSLLTAASASCRSTVSIAESGCGNAAAGRFDLFFRFERCGTQPRRKVSRSSAPRFLDLTTSPAFLGLAQALCSQNSRSGVATTSATLLSGSASTVNKHPPDASFALLT